jgi:hypothetical protein
MAMSESGAKLPPGKLKSLSESVLEEIGRANEVARNMNAFAHSVDECAFEVDVNQVVELMINISKFSSASKNINIHFNKKSSCMIYTVPFFLENLIYQLIDFSMLHPGDDHKLEISVEKKNQHVEMIFFGIDKNLSEPFPPKPIKSIAQALLVKIFQPISGVIHMVVPDHIEA